MLFLSEPGSLSSGFNYRPKINVKPLTLVKGLHNLMRLENFRHVLFNFFSNEPFIKGVAAMWQTGVNLIYENN